MKLDRLVGILSILLQHEKVTAPELAKRFEVSRRTIIRDLDALCNAGIPILTAQGFGGGISIAEGYQIDRTLFTSDELQAIFTGIHSLQSITPLLNSGYVLDKLSLSKARNASAEFLSVDLTSHGRNALHEKLELLKQAIQSHCLVAFTYWSPRGEQSRTVEPYRLVFQYGAWYLFGHCLARNEMRCFKLNRMAALTQTAQFSPPREIPEECFSFQHYFTQTNHMLKARFDPAMAYRLVEEYGKDSFSQTDDGYLLLERDFAGYEHMRDWVLSFGAHVQVLEPLPLREELLWHAKEMIRHYEEQDR